MCLFLHGDVALHSRSSFLFRAMVDVSPLVESCVSRYWRSIVKPDGVRQQTVPRVADRLQMMGVPVSAESLFAKWPLW